MTNKERILKAWGDNNEAKYKIGFGMIVGERVPEGEYIFNYMYTKSGQIFFNLDGNDHDKELTWDELSRKAKKDVYEFMKQGGLFYESDNLLSYEEVTKEIIRILGDDDLGEDGCFYLEPIDYIIVHGKVDDDEFAPYNISGVSTENGEALIFFDNQECVCTLDKEDVSLLDANILLSRLKELDKIGAIKDRERYYKKVEGIQGSDPYKDWRNDEDTSEAQSFRDKIQEILKERKLGEEYVELSPYIQVGPSNFIMSFCHYENDTFLSGFELDLSGGSIPLKKSTYQKVLKNIQKQIKDGKSLKRF